MPPANFVVASAMADAVYTIVDTRAQPVQVSPVPDKPAVRFPWKDPKKHKQRTQEEIEERARERKKKKEMVTINAMVMINALNLAPPLSAFEEEIQEKLELFEKNIYRSVSYEYHKQGVYESRAEAIAKTYAIRQLP